MADTTNNLKDDERRDILVAALESVETIMETSTLSASDKMGVDKAIELLNDAIKAIDSYQVTE